MKNTSENRGKIEENEPSNDISLSQISEQTKQKFESNFILLFGILLILPFVYHKGKDINSDWLAGQWDEGSVLGHAQINKGRMQGEDTWNTIINRQLKEIGLSLGDPRIEEIAQDRKQWRFLTNGGGAVPTNGGNA